MDGNSSVVAESTLENISHGINQGKKIPFIVQASDLDPHADYAIQVHVDSAGAGPEAFRIGDLLHSQSYLVITNNRPTQVEINLKKIE